MDSSGFSSPRTDCFPAGLRVLVVDDDPTWLKILEKMLKKCNYEVTTCNLARGALNLLRERKEGFDIVISDVNMPDMDGFKLLEHVGLEMDLPVIMMSVDGETSRVMKGVQHGACDYLLKPIRMKELRNIWQHVFRKRIHEVRDIEGHESLEEIQMMRSGTEHFDDVYLFSGDLVSGKKRKDFDNKHDDRVHSDHSSVKKARVVWTVDLHQKFVKAVNQIGFEKVGPKKILDLMGVPWLTRENVASHLQKYRLYLSRLEKENELKSVLAGTKHSDLSLKDPTGNVGLQKSLTQNETAMQQNILANKSYAVSGHKIPILNDEPKVFEGNMTGVLSKSRTESKKAVFGEEVDPARGNTSRLRFNDSFGSLDSDVKSGPKIQVQYSWSAEVPSHQFKQDQKPDFHSERRFDHLRLPTHHIQVNSVNPSLTHNPGASRKESDKPTQATPMPSCDKNRSPRVKKVGEVDDFAALFSVQPGGHLTDCHVDPNPCHMWNTKKFSLERDLYGDLESSQRNMIAGTGSTLKLWDEEFIDCSSQLDFYPPNAYLGNIEALGYTNPGLIADVTPHLYDSLNFNSDYAADPVEYPIIDQGLFIA